MCNACAILRACERGPTAQNANAPLLACVPPGTYSTCAGAPRARSTVVSHSASLPSGSMATRHWFAAVARGYGTRGLNACPRRATPRVGELRDRTQNVAMLAELRRAAQNPFT
eukprot:726548-Pyramimonas_sp.AAC.1